MYHYGGDVVGSFAQPHVQPLQPCRVAHAILFDQTHDNQSSMELRTVYDSLPSSALCLMASCAYGSNRGYDELVPHHIHVVKETREYQGFKGLKGIMEAKQVLNRLHFELRQEGFNEVFVISWIRMWLPLQDMILRVTRVWFWLLTLYSIMVSILDVLIRG